VDPDGQVSGPVDAGRTPTGDHITVSSTRLQSEGGRLGGAEITTGMPRQREGGHNGHPSVFADPYR
jgi:hypothetical protein